MSEREFGDHVRRLRQATNKVRFVLHVAAKQRTEIASMLLDAVTTDEHGQARPYMDQVVLLASALAEKDRQIESILAAQGDI
jgi:hypothetical protein